MNGGLGGDSRLHSFEGCRVAAAVYQQLRAGGPVYRFHVWLMQVPRSDIDATVWAMVCVAAVSAMEHGRKVLWARSLSEEGGAVPRLELVSSVAALAVTRFWAALFDFASVRDVLPQPVAADHPFICMHAGIVMVNMPDMPRL